MQKLGCTGCHTPDLSVERDRRVADVETRHDEQNGIFNRLFATATTAFEVVQDGESLPRLVPEGKPFVARNIYTALFQDMSEGAE